MKAIRTFAILTVAAIAALIVPTASATSYTPLTVTVWTGTFDSGVGYEASLPVPSVSSTATFTYTGPIDFVNSNAQGSSNTFGDFFGSYVSGISGLSPSALATLLGTTMSTPGETGGAVNTYMLFSGNYTGGGAIQVGSDDGSSFYVGGSVIPGLANPDPQSLNWAGGILPDGSQVPFDLVYVESNGSPSDLIVTGMTPTPEPSSLFLLGSGLLGLALLTYRRMRNVGMNMGF